MTDLLSTKTDEQRPNLRQRNADRTRATLVDAAIQILERGDEPTMRAVAEEAGVGERTIYRYFARREDLAAACAEQLASRAGAPLCEDFDGLGAYAETLYAVFEANATLIEAILTRTSPDLVQTRTSNLAAMAQLVDEAFPDAPTAERVAAATTLRTVLSGAGWYYARRSCGLDAATVLTNAHWLIATVGDRLRRAR